LTHDDTTSIQKGNAYDKYATKNPIERRLMAGFFKSLDELTPSAAPTTILEVGVGEGEVAARLAARWPAARIVGIDLPDSTLASHWRDAPLAGAFADIARLPFPDSSFDLVLAIEVLEHVPDPPAALRELARVARRDVVLSVPREPIWRIANMGRGKYLTDLGNTPGHINHWSKRAFVSTVAGELAVRRVRAPFPWTMVAAELRAGAG
jgi:SAM-dependent methyltransferase